MLVMLSNILKNVVACLIVLRRSRVSHPRVAIRYVEFVCVVWIPYRRGIFKSVI